ncbi:Uncharacterised protein [Vibrio cholerae]|nr:Uncharacterised protein [Vibrio cholerae]
MHHTFSRKLRNRVSCPESTANMTYGRRGKHNSSIG